MKSSRVTLSLAVAICGFVAGDLAGHKRPPQALAASSREELSARAEVVAFDEATGRLLGPPEVRLFESDDRRNLSSRFHLGVASRIPYGIYRLEAWTPGHTAELRYVLVDQPRATIVLGMPVSPIESVPSPAIQGRVVGGALPKRSFVKLAGIYNGQQMESAIDADGTFSFGAVRCCRYLLLIIGDGGIFASRDVTVSDATLVGGIAVSFTNPLVQIEMRRVPQEVKSCR